MNFYSGKKSIWWKFSSILLTVVLVLSTAGCGSSGGKSASTLEKAQKKGTAVIGFANEKPYAYQGIDGELTGEAVEVARVILKKLGINKMEGVLTEFGSLIPGLQAKRFDLVTAGMFITPERAKDISFANPEYSIGEAIAVKKGNPEDLHSYEDVAANKSVKIAVPGGAIEYDYLTGIGVPEDQIVTVPEMPAAVSALEAGRVDVITATGPSLQNSLDSAKSPNIERVSDFEQPIVDGKSVKGYGATAFRNEDSDFVKAYNRELKKLEESGELLDILQKFDFTEDELPNGTTLEEVLS